jgi:hypothetical protein
LDYLLWLSCATTTKLKFGDVYCFVKKDKIDKNKFILGVLQKSNQSSLLFCKKNKDWQQQQQQTC